ncbi:hypothetical protein GCM10010168_22010 [Actinoplanes ianthinogenes]|uniref:Uncharacterized protein n=1 Tax=Actinoplanes ianthinogenes TaxID=122358 RepID=A0ABN6CRU0_9ACTN|nr:hypothetical protein [Actinoplanes ianthinogenes]BCJ47842.1 hypothetical protein Aiant_84990 [Actinoplanes ianthinogenes]GGR04537.1 hypothetical protein GCM10010168_22010 [Actinoplanes ianthinogenes]
MRIVSDEQPEGRPVRPSRVPLRHFVLAVTVAGMTMFTWYRTGGDPLLCTIVAVLTAAVIDVRVIDPQAK